MTPNKVLVRAFWELQRCIIYQVPLCFKNRRPDVKICFIYTLSPKIKSIVLAENFPINAMRVLAWSIPGGSGTQGVQHHLWRQSGSKGMWPGLSTEPDVENLGKNKKVIVFFPDLTSHKAFL